MNTRDILNRTMYPQKYDDVRRKDFPYYDQLAIATATTEYRFFTTPLGNRFARNKVLPLAGSEIFFVTGFSLLVETPINTPALVNALNELHQQSKLVVSVDNRVNGEYPGADFVKYVPTLNADATPELLLTPLSGSPFKGNVRALEMPIILNSTSAFEFKLLTTTAFATAFNGINMTLVLHGLQVDKLSSFYWDNLKNRQFQELSTSYYDTQVIANGNEAQYNFFANQNRAQNLFSQTFPLSDIQKFEVQNIEVFVNQPDTPIVPTTQFFSRIHNNLRISVDDVIYYNGNLQDCLSLVSGFAGNLTDSGADTTAYSMVTDIRQSHTLRAPIGIPANGKILVTLDQQASSLGITGEVTVILRGKETRRVA